MAPPPSRLCAELIEQHDQLRTLIETCEHLADELDVDRCEPAELGRAVAKLRLAFETHNVFEEALLRPVLGEIDAFGGVRVERMIHDHLEEHRGLRSQLIDSPTRELRSTLDMLRIHLAGEERYFLTSRVLRDDLVTVEGGG